VKGSCAGRVILMREGTNLGEIGLAEVPAGRHGDAWEAAAEWWRSQLDCSGSRGPGVKKEREPGARR